jgi:hypothetical protein
MKFFERIAQRSISSLVMLFGAALCLCASAALATVMLLKDPTPPASDRKFDTALLIAVEGDGCGGCDFFRRSVAKDYRTLPEADKMPLTYVQSDNPRAFSSFVLKSAKVEPETLLIIDRYGREVSRMPMPSTLGALQKFSEGYMRRASK